MSGIEAWLSKPAQHIQHQENDAEPASTEPHTVGTLGPQTGVAAPSPSEHLPVLEVRSSVQLFIVGAHGGSGESTLASLLNATATNHAFPATLGPSPNVLVVARTSIYGLRAAQSAARQWASGAAPRMNVKGVVFMADAPGRTPKPLRELMSVVAGGFPKSWFVPWVESWRTTEGEVSNTKLPKELVALINEYPKLATWNGN